MAVDRFERCESSLEPVRDISSGGRFAAAAVALENSSAERNKKRRHWPGDTALDPPRGSSSSDRLR